MIGSSTGGTFRTRPGTKEPSYEVGYGKPPSHTRFKPGRSGNPRGRPRGARNKANRIPAINQERLKMVVREEAYRMIGVKDGDHLVEIPVIQVITRSVALNAAKGHQRSQQMFTELLLGIERENKALHTQWLDTAIEYKLGWERELHRRKLCGETGPEPLPHPDDVVVDLDAGEVEIHGPMTKEEKADLDGTRAMKADCERMIEECEDLAAENPEDRNLQDRLASLCSLRAKFTAYLSNRPPRIFSNP